MVELDRFAAVLLQLFRPSNVLLVALLDCEDSSRAIILLKKHLMNESARHLINQSLFLAKTDYYISPWEWQLFQRNFRVLIENVQQAVISHNDFGSPNLRRLIENEKEFTKAVNEYFAHVTKLS